MSKKNENYIEINESSNQIKLNEIYYNCTECSSPIEILSVDEKESILEFQCLNNNDKHKKKMLIKEYINEMKNKNNKNINNDICEEHNKIYKCYCLECNLHLCNECLELRNHINHIKNNIIEIQPNKKELDTFENIIKYYENKIEILEKEKINKTKELNKKIKEYKIKLNDRKEIKMKENKNKMEKELKSITDIYLNDIKKIYFNYNNEIKLRKKIYISKINEIKTKYKFMNDYNNVIYKNKIETLDKIYFKKNEKMGYTKKLENLTSIKRIDEIIYNTYIAHNNNYFNSININNILINYYKNNKNNIDLNENYKNLIKTKNRKSKITKIIDEYEEKMKNLELNYENKIKDITNQYTLIIEKLKDKSNKKNDNILEYKIKNNEKEKEESKYKINESKSLNSNNKYEEIGEDLNNKKITKKSSKKSTCIIKKQKCESLIKKANKNNIINIEESESDEENKLENSPNLIGIKPNTMAKMGAFEGFKILIGQFCSHSLSEKESEWIDKKYLLERFSKEDVCLKEVLDYYSIKIIIKEDYKECIQELKTGNYYAHWIICGDGRGKLPNGGNANLIGQYIDALKIYWINGGSLVFWNHNEPYTFECNLFLESAEFPEKYSEEFSKTKVRFCGNHEGKKMMKRGDINENMIGKREFGIFNQKRIFDTGKYITYSLGHNLVNIYEGTNISYIKEPENIIPFNIFSYDHQGGINICFYVPYFKSDRGIIILDGGFTKLFNDLNTEGTKHYILNIAAFTTQMTKRYAEYGDNWTKDFKLEPFNFEINENIKWRFSRKLVIKNFDIVYLLDTTDTMGNYIAALKNQCIDISNKLKSELSQFDFNFGAVFYKDPVDCPGEKNNSYSLKSDVSKLKDEIKNERASGGGDGPDDWVGGYDLALNEIIWRNGIRLIIHITDAPAHGSEWCNTNNHESESQKLYKIIQACVDKGIKIIGLQVGDYPKISFSKFEKEYRKRGGIFYKIFEFRNNWNSSKISNMFKEIVIKAILLASSE